MSFAVLPGLLLAAAAGAASHGGVGVKLGVAGLVAVPAVGASLAFAKVRDGLDGRGVTRVAALVTSASLLALPVLAVLGALLKANTHHRALGGTTFAALALGVGAGALWLGARLARLVERGDVPTRIAALAVFAIVWATALARADLLATARLDHAAVVASMALGFSLGPRLARRSTPALALAVALIASGVGLTAATDAGPRIVARGALAGALARMVRPISAS